MSKISGAIVAEKRHTCKVGPDWRSRQSKSAISTHSNLVGKDGNVAPCCVEGCFGLVLDLSNPARCLLP